MTTYTSDFLHVLSTRGYIHQISDAARPRRRRRATAAWWPMSAIDCTGPSLHVGHLLSIMMLHWLQQTGQKPIALMGGGTTRVGDPSGKDEARRILTYDQIEANKAEPQARVLALPHLRRGPERRADDRQCRVAGLAQLHRVPARGRPALLGQPHADLRFGEDAAGARAGAVVPRVQLHDPAGLRLRRALQAHRLHPADGRLRPVGQHRLRHRPRPAHGHRPALRPHLPADHHRLGRQDGQDRRGRGVAQRRHALALRILAVLAQHRGRRRAALPQAVHHLAARPRSAGWRS